MCTDFDAADVRKDSSSSDKAGRVGAKPKLKPAQRWRYERTLEATEFVNGILIYPVGCEFSLWNLQGGLAIRMSCKRRKRVPAELDFAVEIELAKKLGWIEERPEDEEFTEQNQREYERGHIRYWQCLVRAAKISAIRRQTRQFVEEFIRKHLAPKRSALNPAPDTASRALGLRLL